MALEEFGGPALVLDGVRTVPLMRGAERLGWALLLAVDAADAAADAPVEFQRMWTRDPAMKRLFRLIERAAKALGLSRVTLWRRMKALGLDAEA